MDGQGALFEGGPAEPVVRVPAPPGRVVGLSVGGVTTPRPPGWRLVANKNGPNGFHLIKTVGVLGAVVTRCGLTGRVISESERGIILCPACEAIPAL
jgi:hypothetical protein